MATYEYIIRVSEPDAPSTWIYVASTHGRSTTSGDTPASTYIPGALGSVPSFDLSIFDGIEPVLNPRASFGNVVLRDPTGDLDYLTGVVLDGGVLEIMRGTPGALVSSFSTVATMMTAGLLYDIDTKTIRLHNLARILETAPLHDSVYDGSGGADGDAQLAGVVRPYAIGKVFNATPKLVDSTKLIYQISDSPIWTIGAVKEGGNALSFGTSRANYAALDASAPAAGAYDVSYNEGFLRLGSSPTLPITVDLTGDTTPTTPYLLRGNIAKQIVTRAGTALTSGQVNSSALSTLNTDKAVDCGFFWDKPITKAAALSEVMEGCLGYWFVNLSGELVLGYLSAPGSSPVASYAYGSQTGAPTHNEVVQPVRWKTALGYQRNFTVMDVSQLAGALSDSSKQLLAEDAQWKEDENTSNKTTYPTSILKRLYSGIYVGSDCATEAGVQQTLMETARERWRIPIYEDPFTLAGLVGQRIAVTNCPRYSWGSSRTFILIGVSWDSRLVPIATLWG